MNDIIHDCFISVVKRVPSEEQIKLIYREIPNKIKQNADMWGWEDTEVRDMVYVWIKSNSSLFVKDY